MRAEEEPSPIETETVDLDATQPWGASATDKAIVSEDDEALARRLQEEENAAVADREAGSQKDRHMVPQQHPFFSRTREKPDPEKRPRRWVNDAKKGASIIMRQTVEFNASAKIAAFDFDGTLNRWLCPKFPTKLADYALFDKSVPSKLEELHRLGFKIVIFTNQLGIRSAVDGKNAVKVKMALDWFADQVDAPIEAYLSTQRDGCRKPNTGMWDHLVARLAQRGVIVDKATSFYVGDAAGREGDHSADDLNFAAAIGLDLPI